MFGSRHPWENARFAGLARRIKYKASIVAAPLQINSPWGEVKFYLS